MPLVCAGIIQVVQSIEVERYERGTEQAEEQKCPEQIGRGSVYTGVRCFHFKKFDLVKVAVVWSNLIGQRWGRGRVGHVGRVS
jgi:hypothetical protein